RLPGEAMPQLPRPGKERGRARARPRRRGRASHARSAHPPGHPGRGQHAGLRQEPEPRGDDGARGLPLDAALRGPVSRARRCTRRGARRGRRTWPGRVAMIALGLAAIALLYLRGWLRLRSTSPEAIPVWRAGSFLAGLVSIGAATASSLASCDAGSLT